MATKNNILAVAAAVVGLQTASIAQTTNTDWGWNWKDNSKVAAKNLPQHNQFLNNAYPYPAKPKDKWEIGLGLGTAILSGDANADLGLGLSLTARKAISHVFSLRPYLSYNAVSGNYPSWVALNTFKTQNIGLGVDVLASLNTIRSFAGNPKTNFYALAGAGLMTASVEVTNKDNSKETAYLPTINSLFSIGKKSQAGFNTNVVIPTFNLGGGIARKINDNFNIALEAKAILTNYEFIDALTSPLSNAFDAFFVPQLRLNWNVGNSATRVQPLHWINPNNFVYNELNNPQHMKLPKPVLADADGDGIIDQFDVEANTPAGVAVDARGRALDSDGDGVPDYKDKEKLTAQKCFPVNNDGVGSCPPDNCCSEHKAKIEELQKLIGSGRVAGCGINNLPSINFKSGGSKLTRENLSLLDAVATQLRNNPTCKVKVLGHPEANKAAQQKAYDRVEAIIKYLVEKQGVAESRFIFAYEGGSGDANTIDLMSTTEEGPNTVPAPHPQLKGKQNF